VYRRYSQTGEGNANLSQVNRNRIRNVIVLLLVIALAVTLIITLPVMQNQSETRNLYIQKIQAEVDEALRQTATLSRNAGADSAAILSRIRSNIYAVRMLNTVNSASGGKPLLEDERLTTLQNMVDRYLTYLTTGMDTGEYQTALQVSLSELQEIAGNLN
jgi:hypothetical protein